MAGGMITTQQAALKPPKQLNDMAVPAPAPSLDMAYPGGSNTFNEAAGGTAIPGDVGGPTPKVPTPTPTPAPGPSAGSSFPQPNHNPYETQTPTVAAPPPASTMAPTTRNVDQTGTVQGQLTGMLTKGNPLFEMAESKGLQTANARGLLNSTMAAQAGTSALIQNALPIAQQDAATFNQASQDNQNAANAAAQVNATEQNKFGLTGQQGQIDLQKIAADAGAKKDVQYIASQADITSKQIEAEYQMLLRGSASAAQVYQQMQTNIANIMLNDKLDAQAKERAITDQITFTRGALGLIGSMAGDVNLTGQLDSLLARGVDYDRYIPPPATPPPYVPPDNNNNSGNGT